MQPCPRVSAKLTLPIRAGGGIPGPGGRHTGVRAGRQEARRAPEGRAPPGANSRLSPAHTQRPVNKILSSLWPVFSTCSPLLSPLSLASQQLQRLGGEPKERSCVCCLAAEITEAYHMLLTHTGQPNYWTFGACAGRGAQSAAGDLQVSPHHCFTPAAQFARPLLAPRCEHFERCSAPAP